ncbi:hypothetical protein QUA69_27320 [Microcoleus sp. LAD1_D1]|uniref:hypothetical protein n=1 Tax=Microcoleus sp. LAD1_D1 TaxID=2818812 RepID=UPI002FCF913F
MAQAFANQPITTPIYNQQQATRLGQGDFSSINGGAGAGAEGGFNGQFNPNPLFGQPGTGMGSQGNIYPLGNNLAYTRIYAVVQSGEPIIVNPETGEPYPPGYIPTIQDPNTRENWQPGDSWTEIMEITNAKSAESMRQTKEIALRPGEEAIAKKIAQYRGDFDQAAQKYVRGGAERLYGPNNETLKNIDQREQGYKDIAKQQLQSAQQPYSPQTAQQGNRATPQQAPRVSGTAFQGGGYSLPPAR